MNTARNKNIGMKIIVAIVGVLLGIYCFSLLIPLVWMLISTFKSSEDFALHSFALPEVLVFDNYPAVLDMLFIEVVKSDGIYSYGLLDLFLNSILWATLTPLLTVFFTTIVAYVVSRYKFVGANFIYALGIVVMIIPIVGSFPSRMMVMRGLNIYDNLIAMILIAPSNIFGLNFILLYGAFKRIPWSYAEAAFIDGAGNWRVMMSIMLPMILPTCAALYALSFISTWNDYSTPLIWLPSYPTMAYGIYIFQENAAKYGATNPQILSGFAIVMVPTIVLWFTAQKLVLSNFTVGGIKG